MNLPQRSLAGGEISPSLQNRVDLAKYHTAVKTMRNFQIMKSGGTETRPGSGFVLPAKYSYMKCRIIPFHINDAASFLIELGYGYLRIHNAATREVFQESPKLITSATQANPCVFKSNNHGLENGTTVLLNLIVPSVDLPLLPQFIVRNATTDFFTLEYIDGPLEGNSFDSSAYDMSVVGGSVSKVVEFDPGLNLDLNSLEKIQYSNFGNRLILCDGVNFPKELTFSGGTFSYGDVSLVPSTPTPTGFGPSGTGGKKQRAFWRVTAINSETFEESLPTEPYHSDEYDWKLTWDPVPGAADYNIYIFNFSGNYELYQIIQGTEWWIDFTYTTDPSKTPPRPRNPFSSSGNRPIAVAYADQRLIFGGTVNHPNKAFLSRIGLPKNFTTSYPIRDDDAVTFSIADSGFQGIRHFLDLNRLVILTSSGEWVAHGGVNGVITPTEINLRCQSTYGSSLVKPIIVGNEAIFTQVGRRVLRNLIVSESVQGLASNDLTVFSSHLFLKTRIKEIAYQKDPHSIIWAIMEDGSLCGMTYVREHEIFGWHRHDTDGKYESICSIKNDLYDEVFCVVKREINGKPVRYIEVISNRHYAKLGGIIHNAEETIYGMDCFKKYVDLAQLSSAGSMTLTSSGGWDNEDTITLTHSGHAFSYFINGDSIKNAQIHITGPDGEVIRFSNLSFVGTDVLTGTPNRTIPVSMRGVALSNWKRAVNVVPGLEHLEGKAVSVVADGYVLASPNNPDYTPVIVTNGEITLSSYHSVIDIGLPVTSDLETLDIDQPQGQSLVDKKKLINRAHVYVESSSGIWVGAELPKDDTVSGMMELKVRETEGYEDPVKPSTGNVEVVFEGHWNSSGRVAIRQVDPRRLSVLSIIPHGAVAGGRS